MDRTALNVLLHHVVHLWTRADERAARKAAQVPRDAKWEDLSSSQKAQLIDARNRIRRRQGDERAARAAAQVPVDAKWRDLSDGEQERLIAARDRVRRARERRWRQWYSEDRQSGDTLDL